MKTHEWKAMGRVIYGSRKTAFFEEKKANFTAGLNCTTPQFDFTKDCLDGEISSISWLTPRLQPTFMDKTLSFSFLSFA
jgi:hypothetical protein